MLNKKTIISYQTTTIQHQNGSGTPQPANHPPGPPRPPFQRIDSRPTLPPRQPFPGIAQRPQQIRQPFPGQPQFIQRAPRGVAPRNPGNFRPATPYPRPPGPIRQIFQQRSAPLPQRPPFDSDFNRSKTLDSPIPDTKSENVVRIGGAESGPPINRSFSLESQNSGGNDGKKVLSHSSGSFDEKRVENFGNNDSRPESRMNRIVEDDKAEKIRGASPLLTEKKIEKDEINEIKNEIKDNVVKEVKINEAKSEIKSNLKDEIQNELKKEVKHEEKNENAKELDSNQKPENKNLELKNLIKKTPSRPGFTLVFLFIIKKIHFFLLAEGDNDSGVDESTQGNVSLDKNKITKYFM